MTTVIHLVRHAESEHNITKDSSHHDPSLTENGFQQAIKLRETFPYTDRVAIIFTSPLRRAVQTALGGFESILDRSASKPDNSPGIENGAKLIIYPDIQPRDNRPCDSGSDREILEREFAGLDFSPLYSSWPKKNGIYEDNDVAIKERGRRVRQHLAMLSKDLEGNDRNDIVLVTHGVVKEVLSGKDRSDWPRAGWKSYVLQANGDDFRLELVET
jgi:broad specificity phosphatase PhoE